MNSKLIILAAAVAGFSLYSGAIAGDPISYSDKGGKHLEISEPLWDAHRVDSHAPIGVMGDHTHEAGEWMLSYRYMYMEMEGLRNGTTDISSAQLFANTPFMVAPTSMSMEMHMIGFMFAPTDELTLMAMTGYQFKEMSHQARPGSLVQAARGSTFKENTEGWSDLTLGGLLKVYDANNQRVHLNLGFSAPTGEFSPRAYPMHFTTGTWDLLPGVTWLWQDEALSGGAQLSGRIHLDENDFGFAYGDSIKATTWLARMLSDQFSVSGRLSVENTGDIQGIDRRIAGPGFMSPPMDPDNHGGTWAEGGLGVNYYAPSGHRIAVEAVLPIYQNLNGPQMKRDWMFTVGLQKAY